MPNPSLPFPKGPKKGEGGGGVGAHTGMPHTSPPPWLASSTLRSSLARPRLATYPRHGIDLGKPATPRDVQGTALVRLGTPSPRSNVLLRKSGRLSSLLHGSRSDPTLAPRGCVVWKLSTMATTRQRSIRNRYGSSSALTSVSSSLCPNEGPPALLGSNSQTMFLANSSLLSSSRST